MTGSQYIHALVNRVVVFPLMVVPVLLQNATAKLPVISSSNLLNSCSLGRYESENLT